MSATASAKFSKLPLYVATIGLLSHLLLSKFFNGIGLDPVPAKLFANSAFGFLAALLLVYSVACLKYTVMELGECILACIDAWEKITAKVRRLGHERGGRQQRP